MKAAFSRRTFVQSGALFAAACATTKAIPSFAQAAPAAARAGFAVRLGVATYTFRNFTRAQMIGYLKQIDISDINAKDVKDHLPADPELGDQGAGRIRRRRHQASCRWSHLFRQGRRRGHSQQIRILQAGRHLRDRRRRPHARTLPRMEKFVKEYDIRIAIHNHGPEDKLWPSPLDVLQSLKGTDPRIGCCIDVGHTMRAGTDVVQAIHEVGPRLFNVHMKDLTDSHKKESQVAVATESCRSRESSKPHRHQIRRFRRPRIRSARRPIQCPASSAAFPTCAVSWPAWATSPAPDLLGL